MTDLKDFAEEIRNMTDSQMDGEEFNRALVAFMNDNDWFGVVPEMSDGRVFIDKTLMAPHMAKISEFFNHQIFSTDDKVQFLKKRYKDTYPADLDMIEDFFGELNISQESRYYLYDFLLTRQAKSFFAMNNNDVSALVDHAVFDLTKINGDFLCMLLSWLKQYYKVHWFKDFAMTKRRESENCAYDIDEYLELLYYLFNENYIVENDMYQQAAENKNYADTWLYMCIHFMRAIRNTDILRIGHPDLTDAPEKILEMIREDTFPDEDARLTVYSITWRLAMLPLTPNKTARASGVPSIKFTVPESLEVHLGKLLAICEAHFILSGTDPDKPLVRIISDYERINRYMGEEIGGLFLESNFRSRGVQKSYLQGIQMMTSEVLEDERDEFNVKGYILAALARSHKGSFGEFAQTTVVYLKDAKFSGLTPEFVARELFERGVLSFIPSMLLKMITDNRFSYLPVNDQTRLLKGLNITPSEAENAVMLIEEARKRSNDTVKRLFSSDDIKPSEILMILHRIGSGYAVSKCDELLCVMTAMKRGCPYPDRRSCFGCEYEIGTKSTIFSMAAEYNRLKNISEKTTNDMERRKSIHLIKTIVLPVLQEVLTCLRDNYGDDVAKAYERIVRESVL